MKNYHNIEKSGFNRGNYIGYGGGKVWKISKSTSSYGNWFAHNQNDWNEQLFAFGLDSLSKKLDELNKTA